MITWFNLAKQVNDEKQAVYLINENEKIRVLAVLNDLVFVSARYGKDWETTNSGFSHVQEFIRDGWTIIQPEQEPWRPREKESYLFVDDWGDIEINSWEDRTEHEFRLSTGNVFPSSTEGNKQAEAYRDELIQWAKGRGK